MRETNKYNRMHTSPAKKMHQIKNTGTEKPDGYALAMGRAMMDFLQLAEDQWMEVRNDSRKNLVSFEKAQVAENLRELKTGIKNRYISKDGHTVGSLRFSNLLAIMEDDCDAVEDLVQDIRRNMKQRILQKMPYQNQNLIISAGLAYAFLHYANQASMEMAGSREGAPIIDMTLKLINEIPKKDGIEWWTDDVEIVEKEWMQPIVDAIYGMAIAEMKKQSNGFERSDILRMPGTTNAKSVQDFMDKLAAREGMTKTKTKR